MIEAEIQPLQAVAESKKTRRNGGKSVTEETQLLQIGKSSESVGESGESVLFEVQHLQVSELANTGRERGQSLIIKLEGEFFVDFVFLNSFFSPGLFISKD